MIVIETLFHSDRQLFGIIQQEQSLAVDIERKSHAHLAARLSLSFTSNESTPSGWIQGSGIDCLGRRCFRYIIKRGVNRICPIRLRAFLGLVFLGLHLVEETIDSCFCGRYVNMPVRIRQNSPNVHACHVYIQRGTPLSTAELNLLGLSEIVTGFGAEGMRGSYSDSLFDSR